MEKWELSTDEPALDLWLQRLSFVENIELTRPPLKLHKQQNTFLKKKRCRYIYLNL